MSRSSPVAAALAKAAENGERQDQLRRDLSMRLDRLTAEIEGLFTRSVQFRYSAIRQRRRAAIASLLAPKPLPPVPEEPRSP